MFSILQVLSRIAESERDNSSRALGDAPKTDTKDKMNLRFLSRYIAFDSLFYCHCIVSYFSQSIRQYIQETDNIREWCYSCYRLWCCSSCWCCSTIKLVAITSWRGKCDNAVQEDKMSCKVFLHTQLRTHLFRKY